MAKSKAEKIEAIVASTLDQNNWRVSIWRNSMTGKINVVAQEGRTKEAMYDGRKCRSWECAFGLGTPGGDRSFRVILDAPRLTEKLATVEVAKMVQRLIEGGFAREGEINVIKEY